MGPVASLLGMDRTTLTAALKPLQRRGLIKLTIDPADQRSRRASLTAKGMTLLAKAVPIWERTSLEVETLLEDGDADHLRNSLRALSSLPPAP